MQLFVVILSALLGGYLAKRLKLQPIIGYILAGVTAKSLLPVYSFEVEKLAELGAILLLFSIGLELSISKYGSAIKRILVASTLQMILVTLFFFVVFRLFSFDNITSIILGLGFSLSSTAVVVKTLIDRGESETVHGKLMVGWLLIQDLAVIPMMIILPILSLNQEGAVMLGIIAILKAILIIVVAVVLGKKIVPFLIHKVAILNSRELMVLTSVTLAVGTAMAVSQFGISASLGAFIAGFVISESQENHAVFAETRPLRDLFAALFFVTLGFFVSFSYIYSNLGMILFVSLLVIISKILIIVIINQWMRFKGKTIIVTAFGLSQVGEFSFILFTAASSLNLITDRISSLGIAVTLVTLILTPFIYKLAIPVWRYLSSKFDFMSSFDKNQKEDLNLSNHIIICGYGRVGGWVGKSLVDQGIDFVVIDLDPKIVQDCIKKGIKAIHGDPIEKEVLKIAGLLQAKAVVIAIPDRISQESVIAHVQTLSPTTRIISRVHLDEDYEKLKNLRVDKLVQPEFEAATSIIKNILISMGRTNENVNKSLKSMRLSHAKI